MGCGFKDISSFLQYSSFDCLYTCMIDILWLKMEFEHGFFRIDNNDFFEDVNKVDGV